MQELLLPVFIGCHSEKSLLYIKLKSILQELVLSFLIVFLMLLSLKFHQNICTIAVIFLLVSYIKTENISPHMSKQMV